MKFGNITDEYIKYEKEKYSPAIVIFDGYNKTTVKSHEHARRSVSKDSNRDNVIKVENPLSYSKIRFLSNTNNKSHLEQKLLVERFAEDRQKMYLCRGCWQ